MKEVYTTGQIAKICGVSTVTVKKWIDSDKLPGFRLPLSRDRRVTRESLLKFLESHGYPTDAVEQASYHRVLLVALPPALAKAIGNTLSQTKAFRVEIAANAFEAGVCLAEFRPTCVVVDSDLGRVETRQIGRAIRLRPDLGHAILVGRSHAPEETDTWYGDYDDVISGQRTSGEIVARILALIESRRKSLTKRQTSRKAATWSVVASTK